MTIDHLYQRAARTPGDINEHVPTLFALAQQCPRVTEFGTRYGISTIAFAASRPRVLTCYDLERHPDVDGIEAAAKEAGVDFRFVQANVLHVDILPTDLLFVDTLHTGDQVEAELARHGDKASRFIAFHDTETFGEHGELPGSPGLNGAIRAYFEARPEWRLKAHYPNNNGLTVYERGETQ